MPYFKFLLLCLSSLFLTSCASLSKEECLNADWYEIGYYDGVEGKKRSRFNAHIKACAEHNIRADKKPYFRGREKGLLEYCTPSNGLEVGLAGKDYKNVCPSNSERRFLKKYRQGKAIYDLEQEINNHENRISTLERKLKKKADKLSEDEKKDYRREIEDLEIRIDEKTKHLYYLKGQAGV